jgi:hypothetical protein
METMETTEAMETFYFGGQRIWSWVWCWVWCWVWRCGGLLTAWEWNVTTFCIVDHLLGQIHHCTHKLAAVIQHHLHTLCFRGGQFPEKVSDHYLVHLVPHVRHKVLCAPARPTHGAQTPKEVQGVRPLLGIVRGDALHHAHWLEQNAPIGLVEDIVVPHQNLIHRCLKLQEPFAPCTRSGVQLRQRLPLRGHG